MGSISAAFWARLRLWCGPLCRTGNRFCKSAVVGIQRGLDAAKPMAGSGRCARPRGPAKTARTLAIMLKFGQPGEWRRAFAA